MTTPGSHSRKRRFSKSLASSGQSFSIPTRWEELAPQDVSAHEQQYLAILAKHGLPPRSPVPLVGRYSKPRRWSAEELAACVDAHDRGIPIALMSAALNRNPQDIIYRLLDECAAAGVEFTEVGLRSPQNWNEQTIAAGRELFDAGLTAWRVAALFGVDFEGVEKTLYMGREGYGHAKKNPFAICTDHKQLVNAEVLRTISSPRDALDAFAGEGRFAEQLVASHPQARLLCVELDPRTYQAATSRMRWPSSVTWLQSDNLPVLATLRAEGQRFDLIDLDPFVSCRDQVDHVWPLLSDHASLLVTFGGEYRRSFIGTNRKAIARRYGFFDESASNSDYLEIIPSYFYGWLASEAAANGFILQTRCAIRYPNNCRFWLRAERSSPSACSSWLTANVEAQSGGFFWKNLYVPRFSEVRKKAAKDLVDASHKMVLHPESTKKKKHPEQVELAL